MFGTDIWEGFGFMKSYVEDLNKTKANDPKLDSLLEDIAGYFFRNCNTEDEDLSKASKGLFGRIMNQNYREEILKLYVAIVDSKIDEIKTKNQFALDGSLK